MELLARARKGQPFPLCHAGVRPLINNKIPDHRRRSSQRMKRRATFIAAIKLILLECRVHVRDFSSLTTRAFQLVVCNSKNIRDALPTSRNSEENSGKLVASSRAWERPFLAKDSSVSSGETSSPTRKSNYHLSLCLQKVEKKERSSFFHQRVTLHSKLSLALTIV